MAEPRVSLVPADRPLGDQVLPLLRAALQRLELSDTLAEVALVLDDVLADERGWLRLEGPPSGRRLVLWLHPDLLLREGAGRPAAEPEVAEWELRPITVRTPPAAGDFSLLNSQRLLYQQLLLVRDLLDGRLDPSRLPPDRSEAFQEAWLVSVDGRLQRAGLPHLSAAQRRLRFLRTFAVGGVLTPAHWAIFNRLWEGELADQDAVLASIDRLPPVSGRRRGR